MLANEASTADDAARFTARRAQDHGDRGHVFERRFVVACDICARTRPTVEGEA